MPDAGGVLQVIIRKAKRESKIGISFYPDTDEAEPVQVSRLVPGGAAEAAGLSTEDIVISINGKTYETALSAAQVLRDSSGDIHLMVRRPEYLDEDDDASVVSEAFEPASSISIGLGRACLDSLWLLEDSLLKLQQDTATRLEERLRQSACDDLPPEPPPEHAMADVSVMQEFMLKMGEYSIRQKNRLEMHEALVTENRAATSRLAEVQARRREIEDCGLDERLRFSERCKPHEIDVSEEEIELLEAVCAELGCVDSEAFSTGSAQGEQSEDEGAVAGERVVAQQEEEFPRLIQELEPPKLEAGLEAVQCKMVVANASAAGRSATTSLVAESMDDVVLEQPKVAIKRSASFKRSNSFGRRKPLAEAQVTHANRVTMTAEAKDVPAAKKLGTPEQAARLLNLRAERLARARSHSEQQRQLARAARTAALAGAVIDEEIGAQIAPL